MVSTIQILLSSHFSKCLGKLGSMVLSLKWNTESNMLAALQDSRLTVYLYPSVIFVDKSLLGRTMIETGKLIIVIIEHKNPSNKANNI